MDVVALRTSGVVRSRALVHALGRMDVLSRVYESCAKLVMSARSWRFVLAWPNG